MEIECRQRECGFPPEHFLTWYEAGIKKQVSRGFPEDTPAGGCKLVELARVNGTLNESLGKEKSPERQKKQTNTAKSEESICPSFSSDSASEFHYILIHGDIPLE
jgi:hypothetical protein